MNGKKVSVVLPASGSGERFGSKPPKQYCKVLDIPLIVHTIYKFHKCSWISEIIVPVSSCFLQHTRDIVNSFGLSGRVRVIEGCQARHRSIFAGIKCLKESVPDVVIIHDGVRAFAEESLIQDVATAALEHGASGVVRPLVSTVVAPDSEGFLEESLDRSQYRASEMPQGFRYNVINAAYEKATDFDFDYGTECLLLAKKYTGTKAKLIDGPDYLWKVTYRKDLFSAEELLKEQLLRARIHGDPCEQLKEALLARCAEKRLNVEIPCDQGNKCSKTQPSCNSHVHMYTQFDEELMSSNTDKPLEGQSNNSYIQLPACIVHVYVMSQIAPQERLQCMSVCKSLADKHVKALVYAVMSEGSPDHSRLSEMIVDVMWNRTRSLSGQTLFL